MNQRLERNGFQGEFRIEYIVGSGSHALAFVVRVGDFLFQSPVSYYSSKKLWDVAPGYEKDGNPEFTRPVTLECVLCHAGHPLAVRDTLNRYEQPAFVDDAISCDRCHGSGEAHTAAPSRANILNPAGLPPRARDSICEQCHLGGEARVPNPGKQISDFQPGQDLESIFTVYVAKQGSGEPKVVSHAEQLARSVCARQSGSRMWCGTCHDPHSKPIEVSAYFRSKCLECHGAKLLARHRAPSDDCINCHMPRQIAKDGGHSAFTDHRIERRPSPREQSRDAASELVRWGDPEPRFLRRNLGLANIIVGEREESVIHLDAGFRLLSGLEDSFAKDPAVLTALAMVLVRKEKPLEAARLYEEVLKLRPDYAPYYVNAATAWNRAGDSGKAIRHLEKAMEMDRSLESAYLKLAEIYSRGKRTDLARQTLQRYLQFMPGNITVQRLVR